MTHARCTTAQLHGVNALELTLVPAAHAVRGVPHHPQDFQADEQGYPWVMGRREVEEGAKVIITARDDTSSDDM